MIGHQWHLAGQTRRTDRGTGFAIAHQRQILFARVKAQQPIVEHAARNRRGAACAKARVFHNHRHGNFRVISRGKGFVQGVVTLVLFQLGCVIAVFLPYGDGLGCAGFAATDIFRAGKRAAPRTLFGNTYHGIFNHSNMLRLIAQMHRRGLRQRRALTCHHILHSHTHMGAIAVTAVYHRRQSVRQLQHGEVVIALPDAKGNRFTSNPIALPGIFSAGKAFALPSLVW